MRVVKLNLGFTIRYNVVGLGLAAAGILPAALAAATQSLPDFGIVPNSARVLRKAARTGQPPRGGSFSARTYTAKTPSRPRANRGRRSIPSPTWATTTYDALQHPLNCDERLGAKPGGLVRRMADLLGYGIGRLLLRVFACCVHELVDCPAEAGMARPENPSRGSGSALVHPVRRRRSRSRL